MLKMTQFFLGVLVFLTLVFVLFFAEKKIPEKNLQSTKRELARSGKESLTQNKKRELELGVIKNQTNKTKGEPKVILNDPALKQAWGIQKSEAQKAWSLSQGSENIIVAVIDTGCDLQHEDLAPNYWKNPKEIPGNKIDDDGNGFIDDINGWNFVDSNHDLTDNHGHGTHIAGIIGAVAGNGKGIAGIAPKVRIMCLKYYDPKKPSDHLKNTISAIHYAIENGAHVINYSGGGVEPSESEMKAIEKAQEKGILFVAAAGNERSNSDIRKYYPADYGLDNIISVTAINPSSEVLPSSNYGLKTVDLAAPGQNILSTLPGNSYGLMTGTSQATAFVTGAAVLIMARHPDFDYKQVKKHILQTGDPLETLVGKTRTSRQLNLYKALVMVDQNRTLTGVLSASPSNVLSNPNFEDSTHRSPVVDLYQFRQELFIKTKPVREAADEQ